MRKTLTRFTAGIRAHRGWSGLAAGLVAGLAGGVALTVLYTTFAVPLLDRDELEDGRLVILSGRDDSIGGQRQALIDQWNELEDKPDAEIVVLSGLADAQRSEMVRQAQAESAGVDIFNLDVTWIREFSEAGYVRPLADSTVVLDGFLKKPLQTCRYDGELWCLPFNTDAGLLYYRSDLLGDRPPTTWPAVVNAIGQAFAGPVAQRAPKLQAGYTGQLAAYEGLTVNALESIWAAGGEVVDSRGRVVVDSPEAEEGLRRLANGLRPGDPQMILPAAVLSDETASTEAFRDGQVLFMRGWPVAHRALAESGSGEPGGPVVPFAVAPLPGPSVLGGQNLAIATHSDQPRAAQELVEFLTSDYSQQLLFERGGLAATKKIVYQDVGIRQRYPYAETLRHSVEGAGLRPQTAHYALFSEVFRDGVRQALGNGGRLPEDFTSQLTEALRGRRPS